MLTLDSIDERLSSFFAGDRSLTDDPYPLWRELRELEPVHWFGGGVIVTSHALNHHVYRHHEIYETSRRRGRFPESLRLLGPRELELLDEVIGFERMYMSSLNGAEHRRVRGAVQRAYTTDRLDDLRVAAETLTDELLDRLAQEEVCDLIELSYRVPLLVIGDMLGAPREDADRLKHLGDAVSAHKHYSPVPPETVYEAHAGIEAFRAYVKELIARGRVEGGRTALARTLLDAGEADRLSEDELAATMVLTLFAGHETTTNLLGNGTLALMRFRDQWELLCAQPRRMRNAVEEMLRFDTPVQGMGRVATVGTELGGVALPAGTVVRMMNAAANRDPQVFTDPDRLDISRTPIEHLTFGRGLHTCIGAPLARIEGQVVFSALVRRFPDMELAVALDELEWNGDPQMHGLRHLPIRLGRDRGTRASAAA